MVSLAVLVEVSVLLLQAAALANSLSSEVLVFLASVEAQQVVLVP